MGSLCDMYRSHIVIFTGVKMMKEMSEACARFWIGLWLISATVFGFAFVIYDGQKDWPDRECIEGKLYIHHNDGVYIKADKECVLKEIK